MWQTIQAGGEWRGLFHNRRKDGSLYWEAAVITGLRDAEGKITHFRAVKEDITERKRLEAEVDARQKELTRTQALTEMGRMATMLAHDLRNPLSSVKTAVQVLAKRAQHGEESELAQIGQEQVRYMEDIIRIGDRATNCRTTPGTGKSGRESTQRRLRCSFIAGSAGRGRLN